MSTITINTSTQLTSHLYNVINIPSSVVLKCSCCQNEETEKYLQESEGSSYFRMPDRYVDIYVCGFCKKFDQPKCEHCWDAKPCCGHREKVLYKEYFGSIKKELLNNVTNLVKNVKKYNTTTPTSMALINEHFIQSSSAIINQLILTLTSTQQQLKQEISENIQLNNMKLAEIYNEFEQELLFKVHPYSKEGQERYQSETNNKRALRFMSLCECDNLMKLVENFKRRYDEEAYELSERYVERVNDSYKQMLFNRVVEEFKKILTPLITYKSSLCQTVESYGGMKSNVDSSGGFNGKRELEVSVLKMEEKISRLETENKLLKRKLEEMSLRVEELNVSNSKENIVDDKIELMGKKSEGNNNKIKISNEPTSTQKPTSTTTTTRPRRPSETTKRINNTQQQELTNNNNSSWLEDVVNEINE